MIEISDIIQVTNISWDRFYFVTPHLPYFLMIEKKIVKRGDHI